MSIDNVIKCKKTSFVCWLSAKVVFYSDHSSISEFFFFQTVGKEQAGWIFFTFIVVHEHQSTFSVETFSCKNLNFIEFSNKLFDQNCSTCLERFNFVFLAIFFQMSHDSLQVKLDDTHEIFLTKLDFVKAMCINNVDYGLSWSHVFLFIISCTRKHVRFGENIFTYQQFTRILLFWFHTLPSPQ